MQANLIAKKLPLLLLPMLKKRHPSLQECHHLDTARFKSQCLQSNEQKYQTKKNYSLLSSTETQLKKIRS